MVSIDRQAAKVLPRLPAEVRQRVSERIEALTTDPRPADCKKLTGKPDLYRIRVGDYRIVYTIRDGQLLVVVVRIGNRRDVYRNL